MVASTLALVVAERRVVAAPQRVVLQQVALRQAALQQVALQQAVLQALGPTSQLQRIDIGLAGVVVEGLRVPGQRGRWPADDELRAERRFPVLG